MKENTKNPSSAEGELYTLINILALKFFECHSVLNVAYQMKLSNAQRKS